MEATFFERHPAFRDVTNVILFVVAVLIGTLFINTFIFRSFSVSGPSMQETLHTGDRLIVNRLPVTWDQVRGKTYVPDRSQVIVFKNPKFGLSISEDEYLVKRVIAFAGEKVTVENGNLVVYNDEHPEGFNPDEGVEGPKSPSSWSEQEVVTVPDRTVFVAGDNRIGGNSYDSRTGLGTVPLHDIVGPVSLRIYPFTDLRSF